MAETENTGQTGIRFDGQGLVPAVLQDADTGEVLMVAWMNREALRLTLATNQAHFWSRSREELWHKGATSGNYMNVREVRIDCDGDTLVVRVDPEGPACHTGERSCFIRRLEALSGGLPDELPSSQHQHEGEGSADQAQGGRLGPRPQECAASPTQDMGSILHELFGVILDRQRVRPPGSYTTALLDAGEEEILRKVDEEATEVALAAKEEGDERLISEMADLLYHLLVLLACRGLKLADVEAELRERRR